MPKVVNPYRVTEKEYEDGSPIRGFVFGMVITAVLVGIFTGGWWVTSLVIKHFQ